MNLYSIRIELASIIIRYAGFQSKKSHFQKYASRLQINLDNVKKDFKKNQLCSNLTEAVKIIIDNYPQRTDHLSLLVSILNKINHSIEHMENVLTQEEEMQNTFDEISQDVKKLIETYKTLLSSSKTNEIEIKLTPFRGYDEPEKYSINSLLETNDSYITSGFNALRNQKTKQLGRDIKSLLPAIEVSLNSPMNTLKHILRKKELARLQEENAQLKAALSDTDQIQFKELRRKIQDLNEESQKLKITNAHLENKLQLQSIIIKASPEMQDQQLQEKEQIISEQAAEIQKLEESINTLLITRFSTPNKNESEEEKIKNSIRLLEETQRNGFDKIIAALKERLAALTQAPSEEKACASPTP